MPTERGKQDTQQSEQGYEIPVPKCGDVFEIFDKTAKKSTAESKLIKKHKRK